MSTMNATSPIAQIEMLISIAREKQAKVGLTASEASNLASLYSNLDKELSKANETRAGETKWGQRGGAAKKGRVKTSRPSTKYSGYDEMREEASLMKVWEARERKGNFVYDEHEEQTNMARARACKGMKVEDRMVLLAKSGWNTGDVVTRNKEQVQILSFSVDRVNSKGELVKGTGKVKVISVVPACKDGIVTIEGNDKDGFYRKIRVKVTRQVGVGESIKVVNPTFGLFYGLVCFEQSGEPSWVEPNTLK